MTFAFIEAFEHADTILKGKNSSCWKKVKLHLFNLSKFILLLSAVYLNYETVYQQYLKVNFDLKTLHGIPNLALDNQNSNYGKFLPLVINCILLVALFIYSLRMWCLLRNMKGLAQNLITVFSKLFISAIILCCYLFLEKEKGVLFNLPKDQILTESHAILW
jgi:hypothetical protein